MRNDVFNAAGYNVNSNPNNPPGFRPVNRFNVAGGAVGGPVWVPKAYDGRNKSFFHFTWSRDLRPSTQSGVNSSVPTALMKQGNFSENISIVKRFTMFEAHDNPVRAMIRADFFNLFNRTNFRVNGAVGNANFGRAVAPQQGPRIITMGLRIEF